MILLNGKEYSQELRLEIKENAKKFKELGVSIEIISQATGLSIDEIKTL